MQIKLNGKQKNIGASLSLQELVNSLLGKDAPVVLEYNGNIIKKESWPKTNLKENDCIELVSIVGGG